MAAISRRDQGRAATATRLISALATKLSPIHHPAREEVRELQKLFGLNEENVARLRELIDRVPGKSMTKKAERIGISKSTLWHLWHGKFMPTDRVMAAIKAAEAPQEVSNDH